jgi:hypothetical protein
MTKGLQAKSIKKIVPRIFLSRSQCQIDINDVPLIFRIFFHQRLQSPAKKTAAAAALD